MSGTPQTNSPEVTAEKVRQQLKRLVSGVTFSSADRLKKFITFVVNESIEGRGDHLKEYLVGVQVFDKEASFDPRTDPIVRVQARQLRSRLARYYREEGAGDEIVIDLPKGGYSPVFRGPARALPANSLTAALLGHNTIAVCPFADFSADRSLESFCRGIGQEIIHSLTTLGTLRVVAWDFTPPHGNVNPSKSAVRSGASMTVEGGARLSADRIRVTTQLIDGATGSHLWSNSIDGLANDPFSLHEKVARALVARLLEEHNPSGGGGLWHATENLAARNLYLQGRYHLDQRTEEGFRKAVEFFERTIAEDARYANAYSGLADAYSLLAHYGVLAPAEVWTKAASSAATAVLLDENSVESHTSLAHVKSTQDWDQAGAELEYRRAIELNPRHPTARHWYAISCLAPQGRLDEARAEILVAQSLDPVSSIIARDVAMVSYYQRDFDAALGHCDHAIELNPYFSLSYWLLGLIQEHRGDHDESIAAFQRAIHLTPRSPRMRGALARVLALSGKRTEARAILAELQELSRSRYVSPFEFSSVFFALDETERALEWLRKAFRDRCFELIALNVDPRFDRIRGDARFKVLAAGLKA